MKELLEYGDKYLQKSSWKDIGIIKFCLFCFGVLVGTYIPKGSAKCARIMTLLGFAAAAVLIMAKFLSVVAEKDGREQIPAVLRS